MQYDFTGLFKLTIILPMAIVITLSIEKKIVFSSFAGVLLRELCTELIFAY